MRVPAILFIVILYIYAFTGILWSGELDLEVNKGQLEIQIGEDGNARIKTSKGVRVGDKEVSTETGEHFTLTYSPHAEGKTLIKISSPQNILARVTKGGKTIHTEDIPFTVYVEGDFYYGIHFACPNGEYYKKIEAKKGHIATLSAICSGSPSESTPESTGKGVVKKEKSKADNPSPMEYRGFKHLKEVIKKRDFASDKLESLNNSLQGAWFSSKQVAQIMELFDFDEDRISAAVLCYPRVVDPENFYMVISGLEFDTSKEALRTRIRTLAH